MNENLPPTEVYNPRRVPESLPIEAARALFRHYRGSGKRTRTHPNSLNIMNFNENRGLRYLNPFVLAFLQSPKEKRRGGRLHLSTPPLDRIGYRLPGLAELGEYLKNDLGYFKASTIDFGLCLRSIEGPNPIIAEDLADQINVMYGNVELPVLISLKGTQLKQLPGSKYDSLGFKITEDTEILSLPILNKPGYFSREDLNENTCLPLKTRPARKEDDLELIANKTGVTRAYINLYGDIDCDHSDLGASDYSTKLFAVRK